MKRRFFLVLLLLVAGAIVNVAVVWGFAAFGQRRFDPTQNYSHPGERRWIVSVSPDGSIVWWDTEWGYL